MVGVEIADDVETAADRVRPMLALDVGGTGARGVDFHHEVLARTWEESLVTTVLGADIRIVTRRPAAGHGSGRVSCPRSGLSAAPPRGAGRGRPAAPRR
jgi:hypothetical protein